MTKIAIVGFGEVGGIFTQDLAAAVAEIAAFDTAPPRRPVPQPSGLQRLILPLPAAMHRSYSFV